jgi:hypothetical protein
LVTHQEIKRAGETPALRKSGFAAWGWPGGAEIQERDAQRVSVDFCLVVGVQSVESLL